MLLKHENNEPKLRKIINDGVRMKSSHSQRHMDEDKPDRYYFSGNCAVTLVFPYCQYGSLENFLQTNSVKQPLSLRWMLHVARSIVKGVEFLIARKVRHRDLAARNGNANSTQRLDFLSFCVSTYTASCKF